MKTIETTCGYREEHDNGEIRYYGDRTDSGTCYKDMEAFEKGEGVIYIGEYALVEYMAGFDTDMWTKQMLLDDVRDVLRCGYPAEMYENEKFVEFIARIVLETCEWQELSTYLYELTFDDTISELYENYKTHELW